MQLKQKTNELTNETQFFGLLFSTFTGAYNTWINYGSIFIECDIKFRSLIKKSQHFPLKQVNKTKAIIYAVVALETTKQSSRIIIYPALTLTYTVHLYTSRIKINVWPWNTEERILCGPMFTKLSWPLSILLDYL